MFFSSHFRVAITTTGGGGGSGEEVGLLNALSDATAEEIDAEQVDEKGKGKGGQLPPSHPGVDEVPPPY